MDIQIRHRRLHAFYESKVLNTLMIVVVASLLMMVYTDMMLLPVLCATAAFCLFAGYSLWIWIKKPEQIVVNKWISSINGCYTFYFIAFAFIYGNISWSSILSSGLWCIVPSVGAIFVLFFYMTQYKDEIFDIYVK